jgi:hypothetical protein
MFATVDRFCFFPIFWEISSTFPVNNTLQPTRFHDDISHRQVAMREEYEWLEAGMK